MAKDLGIMFDSDFWSRKTIAPSSELIVEIMFNHAHCPIIDNCQLMQSVDLSKTVFRE